MEQDFLFCDIFFSLTKEDVVMGMLKNFEMAKEDETAQEKWKMARKLKRQVIDSYGLKLTKGNFSCSIRIF